MPCDVQALDERIQDDLKERMRLYDRQWLDNRNFIKNKENKTFLANLAREFCTSVRNKLISQNFMFKVTVDNADYAKRAQEFTIMSNSIARSMNMKSVLDDCAETSLTMGTAWIEVGHSLDYHSVDPDRSFVYNGVNNFDPASMEDEWEEVPEEHVSSQLGAEKENVIPFDPFQKPPEPKDEKAAPVLAFDPNFGTPWIKEISPFMVVIPHEVKRWEDADYVTKLVLISKQELSMITEQTIPENVIIDKKYDAIIREVPGAKYIKEKVLLAVTYIRRDRNDPSCSSYYVCHVLGHPDIVIKNAPNPFGGMIPIIPLKVRKEMNYWDRAYIEDMIPHSEAHSRIVKAAYKRINFSLNLKWAHGQNTSINPTEKANLNNPNYQGSINLESGDPKDLVPINIPGLSQDIIQGINLSKQLAQGASNLSDMDRGTPIKKISARQTGALLENSDITLSAMRVPVQEVSAEIMLKLIHLLNLFSPPRAHTYYFGGGVVNFEPGGRDFTGSYSYNFQVKDLEGPEDPEQQIVLVNFVTRIVPMLKEYYDMKYIADEIRRAMGFAPDAMNPAIYAPPGAPPGTPGAAPANPVLQPELFGEGGGGMEAMLQSGGGGEEHPERMMGDQGVGSGQGARNLLAGQLR